MKYKKQDKKKERALLVWGINKNLMKSFKLVCVLQGITMKSAVIELLKEFCERAGHKKGI